MRGELGLSDVYEITGRRNYTAHAMRGVMRVIAVKCEVPVAGLNTRGRGGPKNAAEIVWIIIIARSFFRAPARNELNQSVA